MADDQPTFAPDAAVEPIFAADAKVDPLGTGGDDFSWKKTYQDIRTEIGNEASAGAADVAALADRDKMGPVEGLMALPKAVVGAGRVAMSPVVGTAKSVIGHGMANAEHWVGENVVNPALEHFGYKPQHPDAAQMYETAKGDVDTAMSAARPAGAPVKAPGVGAGYEWKGPVAAKPAPTGVVDQPETQEFFDAANNHYSNMRGFGVEINPSAMNGVADNITTELHAEGYRPRNSKVFADVDELRKPAGQNHEISDIESVRKVLQKTAKDPSERDAARRAIGHIDDYLANLKNNPQDVVVNPHFAGRVSDEALAARGNYAVAKRSEDIDEAMDKAQRQAASGGAGGNINNAIRQQLKSLRNNKRTMRGWSDEEKAELDKVISGSATGNAARQAGKFAPHGIVSTVMAAGAGHALAPGLGEVAVPAAGWIAKKIGDRITQAAAARLQNVIKARSPLGKQNSINAAAQSALAPPVSRVPRLLTSGSAAALPHVGGPVPRIYISPRMANQDDQNKPLTSGFARGGNVADHSGGKDDSANHNHNPTEAQKKAGNYSKSHRSFHGLDITIENLKGRDRTGVGKDGKQWKVRMPSDSDYGYIKRTEGADGDHIDVYLGPNEKSDQVFVVDQKDAETGRFDEHKCLLGFNSEAEARKTYRAGFSDGKDRIKHLRRMSMAEFKDWLEKGDTSKQIKHYGTGGFVRSAALSIAYQSKRG